MSDTPAMTCEEYCSSQGFPAMGYAEPALHRQPGSDAKSRAKHAARLTGEAAEYDAIRSQLREHYWDMVRIGKMKEPSRVERLRRQAAGHPDNESTQAAIRLLKKMEPNDRS